MSEKKRFYIKYLNNRPVEIETHYTPDGQDRRRPLSTVSQLIDGFQARPGSLLANIDSGLITLHTSETDEAPLESDQPLSLLETGKTAKTALIIKAKTAPEQPPAAEFEELKAKLIDLEKNSSELRKTVTEYIQRAETVQISNLSIAMIQDDGFTCESIPVKSITNVDFEQPEKFEWPVKNNEKAKKNTDAYLAYVQDFFEPFFKLAVRKSIEDPALNTTVGKNPRHLKGNADLYVTPASCLTICRNQLCMVFELKPNEITPKNLAQAIGYVIAANSLFDARGRPSPVGVLTDLADQWRLIWVGKEGQICYAETEELPNGKPQPLTRETALYYIRKYIEDYHNLLVQESKSGKRHAEDEVHWAYGELESGRLKKVRIDVEDNMLDVLETPEEIALYEMRKRMMMTPLFDIPPAAEHMSYFG